MLKVREISWGVVPPRIVTFSQHGAIFARWRAKVGAKFASFRPTKLLRTHQDEGKTRHRNLANCFLKLPESQNEFQTVWSS